MKKISSSFKYFLILLVVVLLGLWVYVQSHQPQLKGKLQVAGFAEEVNVYYDTYGIPHIYAKTAADAYRAFGYVHAADRLFQMELMRRVGAGRLSEIFGGDLKETDAFFRTVGTNRKAKEDAAGFDSLGLKEKEIITAYLEGVNEYIRHGKLPLEYKLLGLKREEYTVEDMYCIMGYMAYSFAAALRTDPIVESIKSKYGEAYLRDLDLGLKRDTATVKDTVAPFFGIGTGLQTAMLLDKLPVPMLEGSNSWAIAPSNTLSNKVLLANDTHIKYAAPAVWYEAHIEYPGFGFYGNFLAGIPLALVGHSRSIAWGITMFEDDDSDFFYETFAASDSSMIIAPEGPSLPVKKYKEVIKVDGEKDTTLTVYESDHGVIINSFLVSEESRPVSMYWNYTKVKNNLLSAFHKMNRAADLAGFTAGVSLISSPGLNVVYGDAAGNIASFSAGNLIIRRDSQNTKTFLDAAQVPIDYSSFYSFDENPQTINPDTGYVISANEDHLAANGISYPGYYAPNTRYNRLDTLLESIFPATIDGMQRVVTDVVSENEAAVAAEMVKVISNSDQLLSTKEERVLELLVGWNGSHQLADVHPTIYYKLLYTILRKTFRDELGDEMFDQFLTTFLLKRSYAGLLSRDDSPWWDNLRTANKRETRTGIFTDSFVKTVAELEDELGLEVSEWRWELVHTLTHAHPMGEVDVLSHFFNVGPFPAPGGLETINNSTFTLNGTGSYPAASGPAMRILIDFADIEHALSILPTGNSGNVMSPHYADQAEMYVKGKFRPMLMNKEEIVDTSTKLTIYSKE